MSDEGVTEPQQSTRGVARRDVASKVRGVVLRGVEKKRAEDWVRAFIKHWNDQPLTTITVRPFRPGAPSLPIYRD